MIKTKTFCFEQLKSRNLFWARTQSLEWKFGTPRVFLHCTLCEALDISEPDKILRVDALHLDAAI